MASKLDDKLMELIHFLEKYQHLLGGNKHTKFSPEHMSEYIHGLDKNGNMKTGKGAPISMTGDCLVESLAYAGHMAKSKIDKTEQYRTKMVEAWRTSHGNVEGLMMDGAPVGVAVLSIYFLDYDAIKAACIAFNTNICVFDLTGDVVVLRYFYNHRTDSTKIMHIVKIVQPFDAYRREPNNRMFVPLTSDVDISDRLVSNSLLMLIREKIKTPHPSVHVEDGVVILECRLDVFERKIEQTVERHFPATKLPAETSTAKTSRLEERKTSPVHKPKPSQLFVNLSEKFAEQFADEPLPVSNPLNIYESESDIRDRIKQIQDEILPIHAEYETLLDHLDDPDQITKQIVRAQRDRIEPILMEKFGEIEQLKAKLRLLPVRTQARNSRDNKKRKNRENVFTQKRKKTTPRTIEKTKRKIKSVKLAKLKKRKEAVTENLTSFTFKPIRQAPYLRDEDIGILSGLTKVPQPPKVSEPYQPNFGNDLTQPKPPPPTGPKPKPPPPTGPKPKPKPSSENDAKARKLRQSVLKRQAKSKRQQNNSNSETSDLENYRNSLSSRPGVKAPPKNPRPRVNTSPEPAFNLNEIAGQQRIPARQGSRLKNIFGRVARAIPRFTSRKKKQVNSGKTWANELLNPSIASTSPNRPPFPVISPNSPQSYNAPETGAPPAFAASIPSVAPLTGAPPAFAASIPSVAPLTGAPNRPPFPVISPNSPPPYVASLTNAPAFAASIPSVAPVTGEPNRPPFPVLPPANQKPKKKNSPPPYVAPLTGTLPPLSTNANKKGKKPNSPPQINKNKTKNTKTKSRFSLKIGNPFTKVASYIPGFRKAPVNNGAKKMLKPVVETNPPPYIAPNRPPFPVMVSNSNIKAKTPNSPPPYVAPSTSVLPPFPVVINPNQKAKNTTLPPTYNSVVSPTISNADLKAQINAYKKYSNMKAQTNSNAQKARNLNARQKNNANSKRKQIANNAEIARLLQQNEYER